MSKKWDVFEIFMSKPRLAILIGVLVFILGILISDLPTMIASPGWPTTEGKIITRTLGGVRFEEYDGDFYTKIEAFIRYQFTVNDVTYISTSINATDTLYHPYDVAVQYPEGKVVTVYYNPRNPYQSVLEPGFVGFFQLFDIYSYLLFALTIYLFHLGISRQKYLKIRESIENSIQT